MLRKSALITILSILLCSINTLGQNAIRWRTTVKMTSETEGVLTIRAIVTPGWHLYGTTLPKGGPKATVLDFKESAGVKYTSDFKPSQKPVSKFDSMFELTLYWWDSNVSFTRNFKLTTSMDKAVIKGKITYMACDNETCLPPKTENVTYKFPMK